MHFILKIAHWYVVSSKTYLLFSLQYTFCLFVCLFVCLFIVWSLSSYSRIYSLIWRGRQCPWMAAHFELCSALMVFEQWWFSSVLHLLWHGGPFIMVISKETWHSHLLLSVQHLSCHYVFYDFGLSQLVFETQSSACDAYALTHCAIAPSICHSGSYT